MSVPTLLQELRKRGIEIELNDGRLVSRAPKGALTPDVAAQLKSRRDEIVAFLREGHVECASGGTPPIRPVPRAPFMPVSYSQERLWYLNQVDQNPAVYNLPLSLRLEGALRVDLLQRSLDVIEARHESLRTTIEMVDGAAMQRIHEARGLALRIVDHRTAHDPADDAALADLLRREAMAPFDLSRGPLVRAVLVRTEREEHYLLVVMHHVISDGLSTQIVLRELVALYDAFVRGEDPTLRPLAVQFADYATWQRSWLRGDALEQQLGYWKDRLAAPLPVLDLPGDLPRPAVRTANGSKEPLRLSRELVAALSRIGREEGATLFMVLLAIYKTLLHRYAGQDDVVVGAPVANRTRPESADMVGFIANTVVLRTSLEGAPGFRELVRRVRDTCIGAFRHQDMPFQKIVEALNPPRDLSRTPIFQAFFTFHEITSQPNRMGDVTLYPIVVGSDVSRMDVSLFLREVDGEILGSLEYNTDLFARERIQRMTAHFVTLAESAAASPEVAVHRLTMLTDAERLQLSAWNETETDCPRVLIHDVIAAELLVGPDRLAVRYGEQTLTYAQLDGRANRLAHRLRARGVRRSDLVGVCLERSLDLPVALLGVLKAGAAYVPLDPAFPPTRLAYMLEDANVRVVVAQHATEHRLPAGDRTMIWLDDLPGEQLLDEGPECGATPDDRAYVIYTSGSRGLPKGVEVLHRNVVNFLNTMRERPSMRSDDVLLAVTTPSFDIAALELFLPLTVGACVVVAPDDAVVSGQRLAQLMRETGTTVMQATPATWRAMLDAGWTGHRGLKALCGGEALSADLARRLLPLVGELWNMYGPTETTIWSTCARITDPGTISIGAPIGNTVARVVDRHGQQLPVGVPGELLIGGAGVAKGYMGRSELTEQQFVSDPTGHEPLMRFYRTGDIVRLRSDGGLEHLGRADDQVKVQGFRIELGEIEAVLCALPAISEAVATVHRSESGDAKLAAWVVYRPGHQATVSEVRRYLRHQLPAYMVPGLIIQLDAIPRTANGKVNRAALPNPMVSLDASRGYQEPASAMERLVVDVWRPLLGVKRVGRLDNFFELGGHSLLSMRAVAAIEHCTGVRLDPRTFFFQTVQQIAATIEQRRASMQA